MEVKGILKERVGSTSGVSQRTSAPETSGAQMNGWW